MFGLRSECFSGKLKSQLKVFLSLDASPQTMPQVWTNWMELCSKHSREGKQIFSLKKEPEVLSHFQCRDVTYAHIVQKRSFKTDLRDRVAPRSKHVHVDFFHVDEHVKLLPRNVRCFPFDSVVKLLLFLKFYEEHKRSVFKTHFDE